MHNAINKMFWIQENNSIERTYDDLFYFLTNTHEVQTNYHGNNFSELFAHFLLSLLHGLDFTFIDADFSENELNKLFVQGFSIEKKAVKKIDLNNWNDVYFQIKKSTSKINLFTSGTTGLPKKVSHTIESLSRAVKEGIQHKNDVWGFCYNPTHMAGIQVFLQAFFNQNTMVYLYGMQPDHIQQQITNYQITHLSATPTFYRLFLTKTAQFNSIKRISVGGEKSDSSLIEKINFSFPNAKLTNIYASTELGSVLVSENNVFSINQSNASFIKIIDGQLHVHRKLAAQFDTDFTADWYDTGDIVEWVDQENGLFKFISRKSEMINTGGYKVNPGEVEEVILCHPEVAAAKVFGKPNAVLGNILVADVQLKEQSMTTEHEIKTFLNAQLQAFKIPRIIKIVDQLSITRTGKISRNKEV